MQEFIAYRWARSSEHAHPALALEAQAAAIFSFVQARSGVLVQDFVERDDRQARRTSAHRPRLHEAIDAARERGAVLVASRLDRLSRDPAGLAELIESGIEFAVAEEPDADAFMLQIHATVAERARAQAGSRISAALQARKARALTAGLPNPLGNGASLRRRNAQRAVEADAFAAGLATRLLAWRAAAMTQRAMVEELNRQGIPAAGGGAWSLMQLQRVLARLGGTTTLP